MKESKVGETKVDLFDNIDNIARNKISLTVLYLMTNTVSLRESFVSVKVEKIMGNLLKEVINENS